VEEPHLREDERGRRERDRRDSSRTADENHQRHEPDEVLRREDLRERDEAGHGGGEGERQSGPRIPHACVQRPDGGDRERLEHQARDRDRVRRAAEEIAAGHAGRANHVCVVEAEAVKKEKDGGAEALDLQAALGLRAEALEDTVRRVDGEGRDHGGCDHKKRRDPYRHLARTGPAPHEDARQRHEHQRVDLGRDREPEHREAEHRPAAEEQPERKHRQQRRPGVVGVQRDRSQRHRRECEQHQGRIDAPAREPELRQHERGDHDRRHPAERHQHLEGGVVVAGAERRRRQKDGEGAGRVLDQDLAVGKRPVQELLRVTLVDVQVSEAGSTEEPAVGDDAGA